MIYESIIDVCMYVFSVRVMLQDDLKDLVCSLFLLYLQLRLVGFLLENGRCRKA